MARRSNVVAVLVAFSDALLAFWRAFEAVERIVSSCEQSGIELVRRRKLVVYRKRLEGFVAFAEEQGASLPGAVFERNVLKTGKSLVDARGAIRPGAVLELYEAIEDLEDPQVLIDDLISAGIRGKGMELFRAWQRAYEQLVRASVRAVETFDE